MNVLYQFIFIASVLTACTATTVTEVENAKTDIRNVIIENAVFGNQRKQTKPEYPFIGGFVRLAFHDCVGGGHCDGCIDHSLDDNKGLKPYTDALDAKYESHKGSMSRADFYALASMTALEMATDYDSVVDKFSGMSEFKVGRQDCSASPNEDEQNVVFPSAEFNTTQTLDFFETEFGFTAQEVVALMGAHTLGRARTQNSGYEGKWVKGRLNGTDIVQSDVLNNEFHLQLRGPWEQMQVAGASSGKLQWQRLGTTPNTENDGKNQPNMFLNSDISLAWDIDPVGNDGSVTCRVGCKEDDCCPRATQTHQLWRRYTDEDDNALWLSEFTDVFLKMINKNHNVLQFPETNDVTSDDLVKEIIELLDTVEEDIANIKRDIN